MIHIQKTSVHPYLNTELRRAWQLGQGGFAIFDIETTGLAASHHCVYAISLLGFDSDRNEGLLHYLQIEALDEEAQLLATAHQLMNDFPVLISYNGAAFDLPFLEKRCRKLRLPLSFSPKHHVDVYRQLFPYRHSLFPGGMKQVQLEESLGHLRSEFIGGGEVIEYFFIYLQTRSQAAFDHLFRHNTDDVYGLTVLLQYGYLFHLQDPLFWSDSVGFRLNRQEEQNLCTFTAEQLPFHASLALSWTLPFSPDSGLAPATLTLSRQQLTLSLPLQQNSLYYFFDDYRNYDYLPEEDMAIHRSLSCFVDKQHRRRATKSTAYTKKSDTFVPLVTIPPQDVPLFYHHYQSEPPMLKWAALDEYPDLTAEMVAGYIKKILLSGTPVKTPL
ncbi:MAG: ribonuclease H-like domain-containing protein [Eubacteriales bacterium]|nr:ribonuclease H-like domain-containing protein [Eubacteriales bacterium]